MICNSRMILIVATLLFATGCQNAATEHRVDGMLARKNLETVLEGWKSGEQPNAWRTKSPEIVVQDIDWMTGAKLLAYEIIEEGKLVDANMHCKVKLMLEDGNQNRNEKNVTYLIGTSPICTVFRSMGN